MLFLLGVFLLSNCIFGLSHVSYENCQILDYTSGYRFYWRIDDEYLYGAIEVKTLGWIGN